MYAIKLIFIILFSLAKMIILSDIRTLQYQLYILNNPTNFTSTRMSQQKILMCQKHQKQAIFVCSFETCTEHRLICEQCKQKQTLHFSHHANYIYRLKEIKQFENTKRTIPKLEKGIQDCQTYIVEHKKLYAEQVKLIKQDFVHLKKQFMTIADRYQQMYVEKFQQEIDKFDEQITLIRNNLKNYTREKNTQDSFFTMLFQSNTNEVDQISLIESIVKKNHMAFKVRADIINLRSSIAITKNNTTEYKKTDEEKKMFQLVCDELDYYVKGILDKFNQILGGNAGGSSSLKESIVSESKSLAMSRVSLGSLLDMQNDMKRSQVSSSSSERNLQRVEAPKLNSVVQNVKKKLKPLQPRISGGNLVFQGPYLYSTGVYFGQYENGKRHGWGQFIFHDGTLYEGQWQKDNLSGFGRLIRNDCYYEGIVKGGRANGSGNYEDYHRYYSGEWKNDKRNGTGQEQFKTKSKKYTGQFVDDKYNGRGKLTTEQYVYEGKFKDGLFHSDGKIKYNNGETFEGSFIDGEKHFGRLTYPDGSYYDGMFKDNVPNGTGQFYWADGLRYNGQWKAGVQEGIGLQIQDGKQLKGIWKGGKWQKWL